MPGGGAVAHAPFIERLREMLPSRFHAYGNPPICKGFVLTSCFASMGSVGSIHQEKRPRATAIAGGMAQEV